MRAIADQRETIAEFRVQGRTYRLILPNGRNTFEVDRLARDEFRRWIWRWAPYGFGAYRDTTVLSTVRGVDREIPAPIIATIAQALRHVQHGPLSGVRGNA